MENLKYSELLQLNSVLKKKTESVLPVYKIKILSNITCNQLKETLFFHLCSQGINPLISFGNYDNIIQDSYSCNSEDLVIIHYDIVGILDNMALFIEDLGEQQLQDLEHRIEDELDLILLNLSHVPCAIFNLFSDLGVLNNSLHETKCHSLIIALKNYLFLNKTNNLHLLDLTSVISAVGIQNAFDYKLYYLSKTLYTIVFWKEYTYGISPVILKNTGKMKKAIIFDCDNTLWKGVLGEDGDSGIDMSLLSKTGQIFNHIQQLAVWLGKQGVIIGLCSKNNADDVLHVLESHKDVVLRESNIVVSKINWNDKVSNLKDIAIELNIGLDSIIFIDDSPFEIELVKAQLPMVLSLQVPLTISEYPKMLLDVANRYFSLSGLKSDLDKIGHYKMQALRNEEKQKFVDLEEYLASLELKLFTNIDDLSEIDRISQLTQKTNQFNLTTKRYTQSQIEELMLDPQKSVISVTVKDKFGDYGLTGVIILDIQQKLICIDTFLMSCRIMGRNIETILMDFIVSHVGDRGGDMISAQYLKTSKNTPVESFYENAKFCLLDSKMGNKEYLLKISTYKSFNIDYIKLNPNEE